MCSQKMRGIAIAIVVQFFFAAPLLNAARKAEPQLTVTGSPIPGLAGYGVELGLDPATGKILELLVYRGPKLLQALKVCTPEPVPREGPVGTMDTADYNFDGYYDLALETAFAKGNASYCIWLYNPKTGRFVASRQLSQLINTHPDPQAKTVISLTKGDCTGCYHQETYRWSKGQLVPVREESVTPTDLGLQLSGGCGWLHTVRDEKNGKMVLVDRSQVNMFGQVCAP